MKLTSTSRSSMNIVNNTNKDEKSERDDNHVTTHHVREQTHAEGRRLREYTEYLDQLHNRQRELKEQGHIRPENLLPIMFGTENVRDDECAQCENQRNRYVARKIRSTGEYDHESNDIHHKNKEEHCQQIGGEFFCLIVSL